MYICKWHFCPFWENVINGILFIFLGGGGLPKQYIFALLEQTQQIWNIFPFRVGVKYITYIGPNGICTIKLVLFGPFKLAPNKWQSLAIWGKPNMNGIIWPFLGKPYIN